MEIDLEAISKWRRSKWGHFSASEIHHILVSGPRDKVTGVAPMLGKGAISYVKKIARQAFTEFNEDDDGAESFAMKRGKMQEPVAAGHYQRLIGLDNMAYYGGGNPQFFHYCPDSGVSPDLVVWKDEEKRIASFGAEFKSPQGDTHMDYLFNIKDAQDLKKECPEYYAQCQFAMMTFKSDLWHWCSFNEYFPGKDKMLIIEIPTDKSFQDDLEIRLSMAIKNKNEFVELLKNR